MKVLKKKGLNLVRDGGAVATADVKRRRSRASPTTAREWVVFFGKVDRFPLDLSSELTLSDTVARGFPTAAIDAALEAGLLEMADVDVMVVSRRTYERRKDLDKPLSSDESDKLARIMRVLARAEQVLGDRGKAAHWLRQPNRVLGGKEPFELLSNEVGARAVDKVLGRIEHGVFS